MYFRRSNCSRLGLLLLILFHRLGIVVRRSVAFAILINEHADGQGLVDDVALLFLLLLLGGLLFILVFDIAFSSLDLSNFTGRRIIVSTGTFGGQDGSHHVGWHLGLEADAQLLPFRGLLVVAAGIHRRRRESESNEDLKSNNAVVSVTPCSHHHVKSNPRKKLTTTTTPHILFCSIQP